MEGLLGTTTPLHPPDSHLFHVTLHAASGVNHSSRGTPTHTMKSADTVYWKERQNTSPTDSQGGKNPIRHVQQKEFLCNIQSNGPLTPLVESHRLNPRTASAALSNVLKMCARGRFAQGGPVGRNLNGFER